MLEQSCRATEGKYGLPKDIEMESVPLVELSSLAGAFRVKL